MHSTAPPSTAPPRRDQPFVIRLTHWLNVPILLLMAGSGLEIFRAYPNFGPRGSLYRWYPFQGVQPPSFLRVGGWLAGGRHWHFALAWFLVLNGLIYVAYLFASGEWRRRVFIPQRDLAGAVRMFAFYTRLTRTPPATDFYNGLQRLAYSSVIAIGIAMILSGLAIYKPVQLHWLTALFGGYDGARVFHFAGLCLLGMFVAIHLIMAAAHPREIVKLINGGAKPGVPVDKPS
ncbi:MAG: cytochrome b/b6 domain-containing protein [Candidatus Binataceae bacterium]|nr:cytochrome b/b6 domain-containing protein [Candidatus Binataceae bacterium]